VAYQAVRLSLCEKEGLEKPCGYAGCILAFLTAVPYFHSMEILGKELIESAHGALAIAKGDKRPARFFTPPTVEVAAIRKGLGLSQRAFANRFGLNAGIVRDWEQKRRNPDQAARTLLRLLSVHRKR
jgi:putative transcriptional regulator